jgi:Calcineurin-like phosphoesterase
VAQGRFLFLGNYVDHGDHQLHVAASLLIMKARDPNSCFLLRGHHEARTTNGRDDFPKSFLSQCKAAFPDGDEGERVWTMFNDAFDYLPVFAELSSLVVSKKIACSSNTYPRTVTLKELKRICHVQPRPFTVREPSVFYELTVDGIDHVPR